MLSKTAEDLQEKESTTPAGLSWAEELRRVSLAVSQSGSRPSSSRTQLFYLLHWTPGASGFGITVHRGRDLEEAEALDTAVVVTDVEGCGAVRPSDLALVEEMSEEFDMEVIEGDDAMRWPDTVRAPADFNAAAQPGRRSPVEGQAEHTAKVSRLVSLVAVAFGRDGCLAAAGCRDDVDESVRRGCGKYLGIG